MAAGETRRARARVAESLRRRMLRREAIRLCEPYMRREATFIYTIDATHTKRREATFKTLSTRNKI